LLPDWSLDELSFAEFLSFELQAKSVSDAKVATIKNKNSFLNI
jgi:hypothetical protein